MSMTIRKVYKFSTFKFKYCQIQNIWSLCHAIDGKNQTSYFRLGAVFFYFYYTVNTTPDSLPKQRRIQYILSETSDKHTSFNKI